MTQALAAVIARLSALPADDQESIAKWLLAELADEDGWRQRFQQSEDLLGKLADAALSDLANGRTTELNPDRM